MGRGVVLPTKRHTSDTTNSKRTRGRKELEVSEQVNQAPAHYYSR